MRKLTKELLYQLYVEEGKSDSEIARMFGLDRTSIAHRRKRYGIPARKTTHDLAVVMVMRKMKNMGYKVENVKEKKKTERYDLLVNGKIRVSVLSNRATHHHVFIFPLTTSEKTKGVTSQYKMQLQNGRFKKMYHEIVDVLVLVGVLDNKPYYWILSPHEIPLERQSIATSFHPDNQYKEKYNNWVLFEEVEESKKLVLEK